MKRILLLLFSIPLFSIGQNCITVIPLQNADSVVYCVDSVSCNSYCDGRIEISVYPQSAIYYYNWDSVAVAGNNIKDSLCAGTPGVTITDVNGQFIVHLDIPVYEPSPINNFSSITHPTCYNYTDGQIDITTNGGTSPFSYNWNTGSNNQDLLSISGGTYELITTDNNNCRDTSTYIVNNPNEVNSITITDTLSCIGMCDGDAIVIPNSGFPPYSFQWDDSLSQTNDTVSNLCYGLNTVYITDNNGCFDTNTVFIDNPDTLKLSSIIIDSACYQICDGQINVSIEGGSFPYNVYWSTNSIIFDSVTTTINNLCPNMYQLIFTDDNNCTSTENINLLERDSFNLQSSVINDSCYNSCTGQITVQLLNQNSPPFIYNWENGQVDSVISNLCSDSISLELIDNRGCRDTFFFFVDEPSILSFDSVSVVDNVCFSDENGSITINISGGIGVISTSWTGINGFLSTNEDISNLLSSSYTLHIVDQNLCTKDTIILVNQPDTLIAIHSVQDASCKYYSDGIINVNVFGGTTPYVFTWDNLIIDSNYVDSISAGDYIYTVTDSNGCIATDTATINEPDLIVISDSTTDVLCNGYHSGSIDLTIEGGILPYDFSWSNSEITEDLIDIGEGSYSVLITDQNSCIQTGTFIISEPLFPITTNIIPTNIFCFGGSTGEADLNVNGGTFPYSFLWNNAETTEDISNLLAGIYSVIIIDTNGCDTTSTINILENSEIITTFNSNPVLCNGDSTGIIDLINTNGGIPPYMYNCSNGFSSNNATTILVNVGQYTVTVTDVNNCIETLQFTITEPSELTSSILNTNIDCYGNNNGSIDFSPFGGVGNFAFMWNNNETTEDINNLSPGTYIVELTDGNGCIIFDSSTITEPTELIINSSTENSICNGESLGSINITANGGTGGLSYSWSNGSSSEDLNNIPAGNYTVEVTDANNCIETEPFTVTQPLAYLPIYDLSDVLCYEELSGSINFSISGNTSPYTYTWSNGANTQNIDNLSVGIYEITVLDLNNCIGNFEYIISEPDEINIGYTIYHASCEENNDGSIYTTISGGTLPYTYLWSNGIYNNDNISIPKGLYSLEVTDANGCAADMETVSVEFEGLNGCIEIPSGFTPNDDGIHDEWTIYGLYNFPEVEISVHNRWGQKVFYSEGYNNPWDGRQNGINLPIATYYYVIELKDSGKIFNGTVTIKR